MEKELILELCRVENSSKEKIIQALEGKPDYSYVLGQLHMHRMAAAAFYVLKQHGLLGMVNREFRSSLKTVYQYNQYKVSSYRKSLDELGGILADARFTYAILKGGVLVSMYPSGVRTSNDIDLLVLRQDIPEVVECFRNCGFVQGFVRNDTIVEASRREIINAQLNRGEIIPFVKEVNWPGMDFFEVDINVSLDEKSSGDIEVMRQMLGRCVEIETESGKRLCTLEKLDFLIHLCVHLYKEATVYQWVEMGRDLSLYKFLDIYLYYEKYVNRHNENALLADRIKTYGLETECYYAFFLTGELFDRKLFQSILSEIESGEDYKTELNKVYNPVDQKCYQYKEGFLQRLFDSQRVGKLEEADAEISIEAK